MFPFKRAVQSRGYDSSIYMIKDRFLRLKRLLNVGRVVPYVSAGEEGKGQISHSQQCSRVATDEHQIANTHPKTSRQHFSRQKC